MMDNQIERPDQQPPPEPTPEQSHVSLIPHFKPKLYLFGLAIFILIIIALTAYLVLIRNYNDSPPQPPPISPTAIQPSPTIATNPESTTSAETVNWKILTSRTCFIEVEYPDGWNASDLMGAKTKQGKGPIEYCIKITTPSYIFHLGEEGGGVIYVRRIPLGSTLEKVSIGSQDITVNSISDYKRYLEEQFYVQDLGKKSYNYFSGNIFSYAGWFGYKDVVLVKDGYLYSIQLNDPFIVGDYEIEGDQILSTLKFTEQ